MAAVKIKTAKELVEKTQEYGSIHVECNQEKAQELFIQVRKLEEKYHVGYVLHSDLGYERASVKGYLNFWRLLQDSKITLEEVCHRFGLEEISHKKLAKMTPGERIRVQLARVSMQNAEIIFLEEPLLNLDSAGTEKVLRWISERFEAGVHFITTNASMRYALLMPGAAFYIEEGAYYQVEMEEEQQEETQEELKILKLAAKSGNSTLLFEPKDIDYVESLNKCNYISVRGTLFQITSTMDETEKILRKSGFFRCHRSYIVNMQKVERIEKLSKNSFALLLSDMEQSRIPLSKARVEEMKETFGW